MSARSRELAERRAELLRRIAAQRAELGAEFEVVEQKLAPVETGLRAAHWVARNPWWIAAGIAALVIVRPRTIRPLLRLGVKLATLAWRVPGLGPRLLAPVLGRASDPTPN